ncbi:hypothetical protein AB9P05_06610 [Roseivirga sp. BDSF3-8]|uniref:hypothetical protein n=1 Tax=Roseivirga sp. BDSF3-8 TaxID=3241598 RepID=UPI003531BB90
MAGYSVWESMIISANFRDAEAHLSIGILPYNAEEKAFHLPSSDMIFRIGSGENVCDYRAWDNIEGWVEIVEYNPFEKYVSGTFEYTAVNETCDTVRVTDDRFDLRVIR